ncbi:pseudouridine synthase [Salinibacter grassmerensis]|uniref:pseudouridine synthase n=1 Tax=Salinibacter grassmerensis TaxID=3040353 RepID=UPI0021E84004|nr:pseudouridine synthase [Salinibacter grassmerensis]
MATDSSDREGMRINKYIAHAGVCSRRDADDLVEQGRVQIDGERVDQHGTRVQEGQTVMVDGEEVYPLEFEYLLVNKPKDTISTTDDPKNRQTVLDVIGVPDDNPSGLFPVGRLDRNTTGVLLVSNDGDLAHRLMHPRYEIPKIYYVRLQDQVKPHQLDQLKRGVELSDGDAAADQVAYLDPQRKTDIALELHEGRNRQIRRMMEALGHDIVQLERAKYATLTTGPLQRGEWRRLEPEEVRELYQRVDLQ